MSVPPALVALLLVLAACSGERRPSGATDAATDADALDAGAEDAATPDGGDTPDGGLDAAAGDAGPIDAGDADGGPATGSTPSPPAEIVSVGATGLLLRGTILTPAGPLSPGEVLVVGNAIACVAADCSAAPGAATATVIDTHGIVSAGLIDAHNHLAYDFLPEWVAPMTYGDRYEWADVPTYEAHVAPYADDRSTGAVFCPAAKWGELRAVVHGTTTVQGQSFQQSCINGLVRNAEHYDGLGHEQLTTYIGSVRDLTDADAAGLVARFTDPATPLTRYAVHMAEGLDTPATLELASFAGRDTRTNRHVGTSLLSGAGYSGVGVLIHSLPLTDVELMEVAAAGGKLVWSPSSNLVLYGRTADIALWLSLGLTIGIGPDWTPSGEDDMLAELRYARAYGRAMGIAALTPRRLWEMATLDGADVVGLAPNIGRLAVGSRADVLVVGRTGADPYDALIDADARDVRLVLVDGRAYYGDLALEAATAINGMCEDFTACGAAKFLCAQGLPATGPSATTSRTTETAADVQMQLLARLATYARTDLLPLASECR